MKHLGVMIVLGGVISALGAVFLRSDKFMFLGRLHGDIHIEGKNSYFHFPVGT